MRPVNRHAAGAVEPLNQNNVRGVFLERIPAFAGVGGANHAAKTHAAQLIQRDAALIMVLVHDERSQSRRIEIVAAHARDRPLDKRFSIKGIV